MCMLDKAIKTVHRDACHCTQTRTIATLVSEQEAKQWKHIINMQPFTISVCVAKPIQFKLYSFLMIFLLCSRKCGDFVLLAYQCCCCYILFFLGVFCLLLYSTSLHPYFFSGVASPTHIVCVYQIEQASSRRINQ